MDIQYPIVPFASPYKLYMLDVDPGHSCVECNNLFTIVDLGILIHNG